MRGNVRIMRNLLVTAAILLVFAASTCVAQTDLGTITLINGDADGDNAITTTDLSIVLNNLGQTVAQGDLNGDGQVASDDLSILLNNMDLLGDE
jgi:hypothetical protein